MILPMLLATALAAVPAPARPPATAAPPSAEEDGRADDVGARVASYLGAIDRPVPAETWRALGPAAVPHLEAALRSDDLPTRRAAAVAALAEIGGERARALIVEAARTERERFVVRSAALHATPRVLPRAALLDALKPALESASSPRVRAVAADVLARDGGAEACAAVKAQVRREAGGARGRFAKAVARCRAGP